MKTTKIFFSLIVSLIFSTSIIFAGSMPKVKLVNGDVSITYDSKTFRKIKVDDILTDTSKVKTGKNSYTVISYKDSLIKVNENSIFSLKSLQEKQDNFAIKFKLFVGSIFTKILKLKKGSEFDIETPTAVVGVRGTEFEVDTKQNDTTVKVFDGKVKFSSIKNRRNSIILTRNKIARMRKGKLKLFRLKRSDIIKFKNEFKKIKTRLKQRHKFNKVKKQNLIKRKKTVSHKKIKKIKRR